MHALEIIVKTYLTGLQIQRRLQNNTDELSFRDYLSTFLRDAARALQKNASFTPEPRLLSFGRPDYEVTHSHKVIGYIEAEAIGTPIANLKGSAKDQNIRFRDNLYNFLLTNHTEFRLYRDGKEIASVHLPDRKSTRLNSSHLRLSRMPSSA